MGIGGGGGPGGPPPPTDGADLVSTPNKNKNDKRQDERGLVDIHDNPKINKSLNKEQFMAKKKLVSLHRCCRHRQVRW
jgi:hypothetical protein